MSVTSFPDDSQNDNSPVEDAMVRLVSSSPTVVPVQQVEWSRLIGDSIRQDLEKNTFFRNLFFCLEIVNLSFSARVKVAKL